jgi:tetratricopeptide (TPR) repeat protein
MEKKQLMVVTGGIVLFACLFFFGRTIPDVKAPVVSTAHNTDSSSHVEEGAATTETVLSQAKAKLSPTQLTHLAQLENSVVRGDVKAQQIKVYDQLAGFWDDSVGHHLLGAYYTGEAGKLEKSEKKLNFAARLMLDNLISGENPQYQHWLATNAKELFEKSVELNPANDSATIGIGACYLFGDISDNPMQGIMSIRQVVEKHPDNLYGQMMLGLGGIRSGQYDRAIERFVTVVKGEPHNTEALLYLAETYERKGVKDSAVKWYRQAKENIAIPEAKAAIDERIKTLQ